MSAVRTKVKLRVHDRTWRKTKVFQRTASKWIKCYRAITCPGDFVAAAVSAGSCTVDGVPAGVADGQRGPSLRGSCRVLLATRARQNLDRNICRGPVGREPGMIYWEIMCLAEVYIFKKLLTMSKLEGFKRLLQILRVKKLRISSHPLT